MSLLVRMENEQSCTWLSRRTILQKKGYRVQYASSMLRNRDEDRLIAISWDREAMAGPMEA